MPRHSATTGLLGLGLCALTALSACSTQPSQHSAHRPAPSTSSASSAEPSQPNSQGPSAKPKAEGGIDLAGVDPCQLLSPAQTKALAMPAKGTPGRNDVLNNAPMCAYSSKSEHLGLLLTAARHNGLEFFGPGKVAGNIQSTTVAGHSAYRNHPDDAPPGSDFCTVTVGVRPGQALDVLYREAASEQEHGQQELCSRAKRAASAAIGTLRSR